MRKTALSLALVGALYLNVPDIPEKAEAYDVSDSKITHKTLETITKASYRVQVKATYKAQDFDVDFENQIRYSSGSATAISQKEGKTYFITADHVGRDIPTSVTVEAVKGPIDVLEEYLESFSGTIKYFFTGDLPEKKPENIEIVLSLNSVEYFTFHEGKRIPLSPVCSDPEIDSAVYSAERDDLPYHNVFAEQEKIHLGDIVRIVGYPNNFATPTMTQGIISRLGKDSNKRFVTDATINPGSSGSAVWLFDDGSPVYAGMAVGVMLGANETYLAIKAKHITGFLKANGVYDWSRWF